MSPRFTLDEVLDALNRASEGRNWHGPKPDLLANELNRTLARKVVQPESPAPMSVRELEKKMHEKEQAVANHIRNAASDGCCCEPCEAAREAFAAQRQPNLWKETVIDACVVNHLSWNENDPRKTLANLIAWECKVALDPLVSEEARKLQSQPSVSEEKIAHEIVMLFDPFLNLTDSGKVQARNDVLSILRAGLEKG